MKPSLGRTVYAIHHDIIIVDDVYMLGKDIFLIGGISGRGLLETWECAYDQYNKTWFTSFKKAKRAILNSSVAKHYIKPILVKRAGGYYELEEKKCDRSEWAKVVYGGKADGQQ